MVELKFDFPDGDRLSNENYVAVRIGEAQKISRIGSSRVYKFPKAAVGNRRYGKLDFLKRVGSCTVCLDGEAAQGGNTYHVKIDNAEIDFKAKVVLADSDKPDKPAMLDESVPEKKGHDRPSTGKVAAAKAYLEKHHLEVRISDAMQAVLRERPEDPAAFLAQRLLDNAHLVAGLPKSKQAEVKATEEVKQPAVEELGGPVPQKFPLRPSVGTWYTPLLPAACTETISRERSKTAVEAQQQRTWENEKNEAGKPAAEVTIPSAPPTGNFGIRPSVGTWYMPRTAQAIVNSAPQPPVKAPCEVVASDARGKSNFAKRPSVGTWLAVKPLVSAPPLVAGDSVASAPADIKLKEDLSPPSHKFSCRPSVGTWLVPAPATLAALPVPEKPKVQEVPDTRPSTAPTATILATQTLLGSAFWSSGLSPSVMCL